MRKFSCFIILLLFAFSCSSPSEEKQINDLDALPSWKESKSKQDILSFVALVTDSLAAEYVKEEDRIAVFDNDGTLWSEQPMYFQLFFVFDQIKKMAKDHPEWQTTQPFQGVLENDLNAVLETGEHGLIQLLLATHSNLSVDEFQSNVKEWITTAVHPEKKQPFNALVYQPMLEVIDLLKKNKFKVFIVSGGGVDFMRPWASDIYGIPSERIIGSSTKSNYIASDTLPVIEKMAEIGFINDKEAKPVAIQRIIGKKPIAAFGNSDGDLAMLQYTAVNVKSLMVYVHHTDAEREWAYDSLSSIGQLKKGLLEANAKNWTVVDMQKDWKVIYPFELDKQKE